MTKTWFNEKILKEANRVDVKQGGTAIHIRNRLEGKQLIKISLQKWEDTYSCKCNRQ